MEKGILKFLNNCLIISYKFKILIIKKNVSAAYFKHGILNKDDAKIKFLEIIYQWPTFGSAFFEVKVNINKLEFIEINKLNIHIFIT